MSTAACGAVALALGLAAVLAACSDGPSSRPDANLVKVGVFQLVEHSVIDELRLGFEAVVRAPNALPGRTIELDYKNAHNDPALIETIAQGFVADGKDLVYALGTPVVLSMKSKTSSIPIVVGAMTDPVDAGVAQSWEKPGGNVTGTSDLPPVAAQFKLARNLFPTARKVGVIYNAGERNASVVVERAAAVAKELEFELVPRTVVTTADVASAATALVGQCDVVYLPTDNTVQAALPSILTTLSSAKIPVFACSEEAVERGAVFAMTVDYRELGRLSGEIALKILRGASPSTIRIEVTDQPRLLLNRKVADSLGVRIPSDVLEKAEQPKSEK